MKTEETKHHDLKCVQPYFDQVKNGSKTFEVRLNDRNFKNGDTVTLHEYFPPEGDFTGQYSGEKIEATITYVLKDYPALKENYVVFGLAQQSQPPLADERILKVFLDWVLERFMDKKLSDEIINEIVQDFKDSDIVKSHLSGFSLQSEGKQNFIEPKLIKAGDPIVKVNGKPLSVDFRIISEENYQLLKSLPTKEEKESEWISVEDENFIDFPDEDDEPEYTVWTCGCGKVEGKRPMGAMCPRCGAYMEEEPMW